MTLVRISLDLDDEMAAALDQMIAAMDLQCSHELAAAAALRNGTGLLPPAICHQTRSRKTR